MSSPDVPEQTAVTLTRASDTLTAALGNPGLIPDDEFRALIASTLRLYALKAENGMRTPLPPDGGGVTVTDTMLAVTDVMHALNVQVFELSMWQAMTGNCIAPHRRVDIPQS